MWNQSPNLLHHLEQHRGAIDVVLVVRKGLLDALADGLERSEMDDTLVRPLGEDLRQRLLVAQVDLHELDLGWLPRDLLHAVDGDVEGVDEVIHDGDPVASKAALGTVATSAAGCWALKRESNRNRNNDQFRKIFCSK